MTAFFKDKLISFLMNGEIDEFNKNRPFDEINLLDLSELDFSETVIVGANFSYVDLSGTNFSEAELKDVDFSNSDLTSANFVRATILEGDFTEAILNGTDFRNSTCGANFTEADLSGADFSEGNFEESDFSLSENMSMCKFDPDTVWPDNSNMPDDFDMSYEDLSNEDESESGDDYY